MLFLLFLGFIDVSFCGILDFANIVEGDILERKSIPGMEESALASPDFKWPNAEVPYEISNDYTDEEKQTIREAMDEMEQKTCVRFYQVRESDSDQIRIVKEGHCASHVGRLGSVQDVFLGHGCLSRRTILHELMHALGFVHEQNRADRDEYVDIIWNNIKRNAKVNFEKRTLEDLTLMDTPYSYNSIMHYPSDAFSKYNGYSTIIAKKSGDNMGGGEQLSDIDVERIQKLYCADKPAPLPPTTFGGFNFIEGDDGMMWSYGCDFYGKDIDRKQSNAADCPDHCVKNRKCSHFTWNKYQGGVCYLKAGFAPNARPQHAESDYVCGYRKHNTNQKFWKEGQGVWWSFGCDFGGKDITWFKSTAQECSDECVNHNYCTHFTWNPSEGGTCYLKKGHTEKPSCSQHSFVCGYDERVGEGGFFSCT